MFSGLKDGMRMGDGVTGLFERDGNGGKMVKKMIMVFGLVLMFPCSVMALDATDVSVDVLAKTGVSWDGSLLPAYPAGNPEITILKIEIPAGIKLATHMHPVINAGVLTKGELTVVTREGKTLHLRAGDAIVEVVNTWHYGRNDGDEPAEIIVFYAGVVDVPITVKETEGAH
jgi:quercetin dioxygenase-like cupin family protein